MSDDSKRYLAGRHHAQQIAEKSAVAFYVSGHNKISAEYHWRGVHESFAALAEELGYRIEKIATEERTCQTTGFKYTAKIEPPFTDEQLGVK
jgi:DUF1365 family protein